MGVREEHRDGHGVCRGGSWSDPSRLRRIIGVFDDAVIVIRKVRVLALVMGVILAMAMVMAVVMVMAMSRITVVVMVVLVVVVGDAHDMEMGGIVAMGVREEPHGTYRGHRDHDRQQDQLVGLPSSHRIPV